MQFSCSFCNFAEYQLRRRNLHLWRGRHDPWPLESATHFIFCYFRDPNALMWPMQQQQPQPSVSVVTTVWGVASTTSQAQIPTDNMMPTISTTNTGQVMNQQAYGNPGMMNTGNKPYQQSGME